MFAWLSFSQAKNARELEATISQVDGAQLDEPDIIERGRYLAIAGNCASCHTTQDGELMAGGVAFNTPFGVLYSTNITPDKQSGIGNWTPAQFLVAMRQGMRPDGDHLYPAFPYTAYTKVSDDDALAIYAYLNSVDPVRSDAVENELSFPFSMRSLMSVWKALYFEPGIFREDAGQSAEWNRGAYLVEALAHCSACHSPRTLLGGVQQDLSMSGGVYHDKVPSGEYRAWSAPNLTSATDGLALWPREELSAYLETGRNAFVDTFGPMNEVIMNSTSQLEQDDIDAMTTYLKSLPARTVARAGSADETVLGMGETQYNLHCGTCHLPTGLGDEESAPQLARGSLVVQAASPASLINVILDSPQEPHPPLPQKWYKPMESFRYLLDDEEIAALASFVRSSWGNDAGEVTAAEVAAQR